MLYSTHGVRCLILWFCYVGCIWSHALVENAVNNAKPEQCACSDPRIDAMEERVKKLDMFAEMVLASRDAMEYTAVHSDQTPKEKPMVIAFTAYLDKWLNNLRQGDTIVCNQVLVNEGDAYDSTTGVFTAPRTGLYLFSFVIETKDQVSSVVRLVVDRVNTLDAVVEPYHERQNLQGVNMGVVKVNRGQKVWIEAYNTDGQSFQGADNHRYTSFTGVLIG